MSYARAAVSEQVHDVPRSQLCACEFAMVSTDQLRDIQELTVMCMRVYNRAIIYTYTAIDQLH